MAPVWAGNLVTQADECYAKFSVFRALGTEPSCDRVHFLLRLCERDAGLQSGDCPQPEGPAASILVLGCNGTQASTLRSGNRNDGGSTPMMV